MIIDYTFDKCANKINTARILRSGQEQFCQTIELYIRSANDYKIANPEDESEFISDDMINKLTVILKEVRANITILDKIFSKIELLEQTRLLNLWFKEQQIEAIFPELTFPRTNGPPLRITGEYIEAKEIFERDYFL